MKGHRTGVWLTLLVGQTWPLSVNKVWLERSPATWTALLLCCCTGRLSSLDRDGDRDHLALYRKSLPVPVLEPQYSAQGLWSSSSSSTWELRRNADSQVPPQTHRTRLCLLKSSLAGLMHRKLSDHWCVRPGWGGEAADEEKSACILYTDPGKWQRFSRKGVVLSIHALERSLCQGAMVGRSGWALGVRTQAKEDLDNTWETEAQFLLSSQKQINVLRDYANFFTNAFLTNRVSVRIY